VSIFKVFNTLHSAKDLARLLQLKASKPLALFCLMIMQILFPAHAADLNRSLESNIEVQSNKERMQSEIAHLLNFVKNTNCDYERNGKKHNGKEAAKHIKKKYDYYEEDIDTTETFIELSASKSSMSGKAYKIYCPNKPVISSQEWLMAELANFRARHNKAYINADNKTDSKAGVLAPIEKLY
jgi:hypothetical protein